MSNVRRLAPSTIPPFTVVETLREKLPEIQAIYVCTIEDGRPVLYASGNLDQLCMASVAIQDLAFKFLNGEFGEL